MTFDILREAIATTRVLAIFRARTSTHFVAAARALAADGVRALEFTLTTDGALAALRDLRAAEPDLLAGAGTVITPQDASDAVEAGAQFLVAPCVRVDTLAEAGRLGVPMVAGATTPTEIVTAYEYGSQLVKLFPSAVGPAYVRSVREPLPHIDLVVTGGVALDAIPNFLDAGACAVGLGSPLTGDALDTGDIASISARARTALAAARRDAS
ncbi:2-dehydro-3-deoxyphosphogluconate aldolase / (4S)-4-hydroxy-2-oxoglutarate aldolase [Jatrophihabitans endophyticus]|uniref:2-dehydro-3-deoxyphosphogluconate aldolase / (4S)-4-hydroxy-2-oxoglutarate aldolase n=1 Tax=Jatrophihabitans endophyticus TaxID=1206085 RepID=A0A1M5S6S1_9ACTN|nr:bifunctional 4-hydroxy-2-oxoglutarate aldolase/2-dehydro-3-deoxy-phosphogluconate aldolase [Jatrophihabitans endophyticus]SHH34189.1 2-dehydro-3-deoxyphosphogluconate aldolase / (4S)-4-hydroxy-2-oxoglutarate aldolase [Jatrophihabitans endophyticus]